MGRKMQIWWVDDPCGRIYVFIAQALLAASALLGLCQAVQFGPAANPFLVWHEVTWILAAWCHLATALQDPGTVPRGFAEALAPPPLEDIETSPPVRWCKHCQLAKTYRVHHCSTCQRCIRKMDHHCIWMNNCIGACNQKQFLLVLLYTSLHCAGASLSSLVCIVMTDIEELRGASVAALLLTLSAGRFVFLMLLDQVSAIRRNQTGIEALKGTPGEPRPFRTSAQEVFGAPPGWRWLLPLRAARSEDSAWGCVI
mmetsp:Transcript_11100/g.20941  ORF Transcript_11100/g.20941 Transcript_11100/m.20941 type:complete len:255 (+) Transcript_11100:52-816(+)